MRSGYRRLYNERSTEKYTILQSPYPTCQYLGIGDDEALGITANLTSINFTTLKPLDENFPTNMHGGTIFPNVFEVVPFKRLYVDEC